MCGASVISESDDARHPNAPDVASTDVGGTPGICVTVGGAAESGQMFMDCVDDGGNLRFGSTVVCAGVFPGVFPRTFSSQTSRGSGASL
mmetsp:Transcript_37661/g.111772  ORF Transcript_37661/g.111772 Transcript_37661/m.111772 type:complete len:89 (-) Transcript_37661:675-941(-)